MMNVIVKHVIEIAAGVLVGNLTGDVVNKVVKVATDKVKKAKKG